MKSALVAACAAFVAMVLAAGCAAPPAAAPSGNELPFEQAAAEVTDSLVAQTQKLPAFLTKVESKLLKRGVVIDPMLDAGSGQQTALTQLLEKRVAERIAAKYEQFEIQPFRAAGLAKAQVLLTGTTTRVQTDRPRGAFRINLALTDLKTGQQLAQASAVASDNGLDTSPTPYYRDSPVLVKDKVTEGYLRTAASPAGQRADPAYFDRIATATLIDEATTLYNTERYQDSLSQYKQALSTPHGEQLRVLNGLYLTNVKLGRTGDAEQAFGKVVALGIAYNELGRHGVLVRHEGERRLRHVAAPDRTREHRRQGVHEHRRPHEPHRLRAGQRRAVAAARRLHQAAPCGRGGRAGRAHEGGGHGLPAEHRGQRQRQRGRRARPPRGIQDRPLHVT